MVNYEDLTGGCLFKKDDGLLWKYMLIDSGITHTNIGSGKVRYVTPYAKYQYYGISKNGHALKYRGGGMRGKQWFERMKADHLRDILSGAAREAGADAK